MGRDALGFLEAEGVFCLSTYSSSSGGNMASQSGTGTEMKKTLGLTGVTVNAMALIAPGAFLWITFQLQAANSGGDTDMWTGIVTALIIAFLTAIAFSE